MPARLVVKIGTGLLLALVAGTASGAESEPMDSACTNTVHANVVAIEQAYVYNRYGAFNPGGMMYALRRDVVAGDPDAGGASSNDPIPPQPDPDWDRTHAGLVTLRPDKRPRPLVLRVDEGDCLAVAFTNLLPPVQDAERDASDALTGRRFRVDAEEPATRSASLHVNGLEYVGDIRADGSYVGRNPSSLAAPGETVRMVWRASKEGGYLLTSLAAPAGGEGDGGQQGLGLFGSVNVEPRGSVWYRSQVTAGQLAAVAIGRSTLGTPVLAMDPGQPVRDAAGRPVLNILDPASNEIVHSDLNAVIDANEQGERCAELGSAYGATCGKPFREFTVIFHDELTVQQAYARLSREDDPLSSLRDGMGINYGAAGMGAMVLANRAGEGPGAECRECKLEEFFLSSWVQGDPAMVVTRDPQTRRATAALYPDDPSNVHHSYLGDPVRFRNLHAGPKETHVFHLHAHQWTQDWRDDKSVYLDSQTISPGGSFTYNIHWGGSGNRNVMPGDSIFHCHLYPHFAQGMWELWRTHDVFEAGTPDRRLPDAEIAGGTPNPAIVPLPRTPLPPMPTAEFRGYPFYVAGIAGHRPPQPPLDGDRDDATGEPRDGGLPRHVVVSSDDHGNPTPSERLTGEAAVERPRYFQPNPGMSDAAVATARRVTEENNNPDLLGLASKLVRANMRELPRDGTPEEKAAMRFHAGGAAGTLPWTWEFWPSAGYPTCDLTGTCDTPNRRQLFHVNGRAPQPGAPYSDPCPDTYLAGSERRPVHRRSYRAAYIQFDNTVNKSGWHDPQTRSIVLEGDIGDTLARRRPAEPLFFRAASGECVDFRVTNLMPSNLNIDDFQVFSPTDTIGQHIHLVKFDVTSSDGSANGWNYEDATFSPEEVVERIRAYNAFRGTTVWRPRTHPLFRPSGAMAGDPRGQCPDDPAHWGDAAHPWCGAQTTIQRWWADPLLDRGSATRGPQDRTIRTVFTHDHLGPSSHQQHGLYAALVVEPPGATWAAQDGTVMGGVGGDGQVIPPARPDGGPTSYAAIVTAPESASHVAASFREFNLAFADYAPLYTEAPGNRPVNPVNRMARELPLPVVTTGMPQPEGISTKDPGGQLINYRNEPVPLRVAKPNADGTWVQRGPSDAAASCRVLFPDPRRCDPGEMANVFSTPAHAGQAVSPLFLPSGGETPKVRRPGDPATPLLPAYEGDNVSIRLIQGAQEENHVFTMHGVKWLGAPDDRRTGWRNGQHIGISEHFEFNVNITAASAQANDIDYLYSSSATDNLWDGMWGLLRAHRHDQAVAGLHTLPDNQVRPLRPFAPNQSACPPHVPRRIFEVAARQAAISYNPRFGLQDPNGIVFVKTAEFLNPDETAPQPVSLPVAPGRVGEPLILRVAAGECVEVRLSNELPASMPDGPGHPGSWSYNQMPPLIDAFNFNELRTSSRVGLHVQLLAQNTWREDGVGAGLNPDSTVGPGEPPRIYTWYAGDYVLSPNPAEGITLPAPIEFGVAGLQDQGDVIKHASHGAIGALVVEPEHASWRTDCEIKAVEGHGGDPCLESAATVSFKGPDGRDERFREFVVIYQNDTTIQRRGQPLPNLRNADDSEDSGQKGFNYRTEPVWARLGAHPAADPNDMLSYDYSRVFASVPGCADRTPAPPCRDGAAAVPLDPATPLFTAQAGMPVRFRVVEPAGHPRNNGFTIFGHGWAPSPHDDTGTRIVHREDTQQFVGSASGVGPARHLNIVLPSAGGSGAIPGDYMYRSQEGFVFGGGAWGLFRVLPPGQCAGRLDPDGAVCR